MGMGAPKRGRHFPDRALLGGARGEARTADHYAPRAPRGPASPERRQSLNLELYGRPHPGLGP